MKKPTDTARSTPQRRRRRIRRLAVALLVLAVLLAAAFFTVTRGPIARRIVLAQLRPLSDATIDIRSAAIGLNGTITIEELSVAAPGVDGQAARVLEAHSATIAITGLLTGSPTPGSIHIDSPIVRISQNTETGAFNFAGIHARPTGGAGAALPSVSVTGGVLELGEHAGGEYRPLRRLPVSATLGPTPADDTFAFHIVQDSAESPPFSLSGLMHPDRIEISIDELDLAAWPNDAIPSHVRDLHRRLAIRGRILPTDLTIFRDGGVRLDLSLRGVELRLPVDDAPLAQGVMTAVDGTLSINETGIDAELEGLLDGVPARAAFHADRLTQDSPFVCDIHVGRVRLAENLERLAYIPEFVREQLAIFSNPTAEVSLDLTLTRAEDRTEVVPRGSIHLFDGVASYRAFPYEFTGLEGTFELVDDDLIIRNIAGRAESGARLTATGLISPIGPTAEAKIDISVSDVPLDSRLRAGLGPKHRELYDALLSRSAYRELQDAGLIQTRAQARERAAALDALEAAGDEPEAAGQIELLQSQLAAPVFTIGGKATVEVSIHRHLGDENIWDRDILVRISAAGFLAEQFPLPIIAEGVTLRITDEAATLDEGDGVFRGLEGGTASIAAVADLVADQQVPRILVRATDIPVTPLLINAIPGDPGTDTARELLSSLGLVGTLDATARIGEPDRPLFDIEVRPREMTAGIRPPGSTAGPALQLSGINGTIHATPDSIDLDLTARLPEADPQTSSRASLAAGINYGRGVEGDIQVRTLAAALDSLPLDAPIEELVALVNPSGAEQLRDLRARFNPRGSVRVEVEQVQEPGAPASTTLRITDAEDLRVAYRGGDFSLERSEGRIVLTRGDTIAIELQRFGGPVAYADEPLGRLELDGLIAPNGPGGEEVPAGQIRARLASGRYSRELAQRLLPDDSRAIRDLLVQAEPEMTFDLDAKLGVSVDGSAVLESLDLSPHTLAFTRGGRRTALDITAGSVRLVGSTAHINNLALAAADWSATVDGRFDAHDEGARDADLAFSFLAGGLTDEIRDLLPPQVAAVLGSLEFGVGGPIALTDGHILLADRPDNTRIDVLGRIDLTDASLNAGIPIDRLDAVVEFAAHTDSTLETPEYEVRVFATEFRASEIWMSDGDITIRSSPEGGATEIGPFTAEAHGGRVAGSAFVWNADDGSTNYDLDATLSGVRFAPVLRDLALDTAAPGPDDAADESRGVIDARLTVYGIAGGSRRGVGHIQVSQGRVLKLPLLVPLIEVSNLRLPTGEQLELARAQFYIHDDLATFEELSVYSRSIELIGYGTIGLDDQQIDLRVNSRANTRIPLLSPVLENLRDELVTIRVQGTLREPDIVTVPLTSTRAAIGSLFGREPTEQERLLRDIKRRALEFRERSRLSSKQIHTAIENLENEDNNQNP